MGFKRHRSESEATVSRLRRFGLQTPEMAGAGDSGGGGGLGGLASPRRWPFLFLPPEDNAATGVSRMDMDLPPLAPAATAVDAAHADAAALAPRSRSIFGFPLLPRLSPRSASAQRQAR